MTLPPTPPFGEGVPLAFEEQVTDAERDRLMLGLTPETMEDKWVVTLRGALPAFPGVPGDVAATWNLSAASRRRA